MDSKIDKRVSFLQYLNTALLTVSLVVLGIGVNQMILFNEKYTITEKKVDKLELRQSYQMDWSIERDRINTQDHDKYEDRLNKIEAILNEKKNYKHNLTN